MSRLPWNRKRREESSTDLLTGALSRPAWLEMLRNAMARARSTGEPLCVAAIDTGALPTGQSDSGHNDSVRRVTEAASANLPSGDLIGRIGENRLVLILRDLNLGDAQEAMMRLQASLADAGRCAIGVASWAGYDTAEALCQEAIRSLEEEALVGADRSLELHTEPDPGAPGAERGSTARPQSVAQRTAFPAS